jgi:hypothetical protein
MNATPFQNFPSVPADNVQWYNFTSNAQALGDWDWLCSNHVPPFVVGDYDGGGLLLGSGSSNSGDYIQMQKSGLSILANRTGKTYWFIWQAQLNSASLTQALLGLASTMTTNSLTNNIPNGMGFYANLTGGLSSSYWTTFLANGSASQFSGYTQTATTIPVDTLKHTFAIQWVTDNSLLGAGSLTYFIDGAVVASQASTSTAFLPQVGLRPIATMGNATAAAQTMILYRYGSDGQV